MCSAPVTFGGGMTMEKGSFLPESTSCGSGVKVLFSTQCLPQRASTSAGS